MAAYQLAGRTAREARPGMPTRRRGVSGDDLTVAHRDQEIAERVWVKAASGVSGLPRQSPELLRRHR